MKDRQNRPAPLALAPSNSQRRGKKGVVAVRGHMQTPPPKEATPLGYDFDDPLAGGTMKPMQRKQSQAYWTQEPVKRSAADETFLFWMQLVTDVIHVHICAVMIAAFSTFIYQRPGTVGTSTGYVDPAWPFLEGHDILSLVLICHPSGTSQRGPQVTQA